MSGRKPVEIAFARFWPGFDPEQNLFTRLLQKSYEVQLSDRPAFVFYSVFPGAMPPGKYVKIFYTAENVRPPWGECDWAFSFDYDEEVNHPRHLRLPNYVFEADAGEALVKDPAALAQIRQSKTRFCNFVYWNRVRFRNYFFRRLSRRRRVDAPGRCGQNMPPIGSHGGACASRESRSWVEEKIAWLVPYQFTIAFESGPHPGYTTEKICHAMRANSIPIYWGNPLIHRDFNTKSFINYHDFEAAVRAKLPRILNTCPVVRQIVDYLYVRPRAVQRTIQRVLEVADNLALYEQYLSEPWFRDNKPSRFFDLARLERRLQEIFGEVKDA